MPREILTALAGGLAGAVLYLSVRTGTPGSILLAYLSPLPLLFAGLASAWIWAGAACITALAGIAAGASMGLAAMFAVVVAVPVLIVTRQGLLSRPGATPETTEWYPPGLLLGWLTGYALAGLAVASVWLSGAEGGMTGLITQTVSELVRRLPPEAQDPRVAQVLLAMAPYVPGMMATLWLIVIAGNAALAQKLLTRLGWNRRPTPAYSMLELPRWLLVAVAVSALASLMSGQIGMTGRNGLIISLVPFLFLGLAVVHVLTRGRPARQFVLAGVYMMLLMFTWSATLLVGIGIIEQWVRLRHRFAASPDDQEEE